jgi:uncharacterized membrane protein
VRRWLPFLSLLLAASAADAASFTWLGFPPGYGGASISHGVSADGATVVGGAVINPSPDPSSSTQFRWTAGGGMQNLGPIPPLQDGEEEFAMSVSADGSVVVGFGRNSVAMVATRWTQATGYVQLGAPPGHTESWAQDVSADGNVIVGQSFGVDARAFRWTQAGGMVALPGPSDSGAWGISADGSVIVGNAGGQAYRWTESGAMALGDLPGGSLSGAGLEVSADGTTIVGFSNSGFDQAFVWTSAGGMVGLGDLPGGTARSLALAVSGDGSLVGGLSGTAVGDEAFLWTASGGMRRLEDVLVQDYGLTEISSWILESVDDISPDGRWLTGHGRRTQFGRTEAFLVMIPEPHTAVLFAAGLALLARRRTA